MDRKMRQTQPGIYHPIAPDLTVGELANRLCELAVEVRTSRVVEISSVREMESVFDALSTRGFDFTSSHYEMLCEVINDITLHNATNATDLKLLQVRQQLRQSLVLSITEQHDSIWDHAVLDMDP
jgi:hypothetical protein